VSVSGVTLAAVLPQQTLASVPTAVLSATIQGVSLLAPGGRTVAGAFSAQVLALTEGVLKAMLLSRWKWAAIVLLMAGVVCAAGLLAQNLLPAQRGDAEQGGLALTLLEQADYSKYGTEEDAIVAARFVFLGGFLDSNSPRSRDRIVSADAVALGQLSRAGRETFKAKLNPETGHWTVNHPYKGQRGRYVYWPVEVPIEVWYTPSDDCWQWKDGDVTQISQDKVRRLWPSHWGLRPPPKPVEP
jgi:hypothetical protein